VVAIAQPLFQPRAQLRIVVSRRDAAGRKAKPRRLSAAPAKALSRR